VKQQSEHLSNAQIEQYGKRASGAGSETEDWVEQHLADCPSCRSRVLDFQRTRFALLPDPKVNKVSTSDCSSEADLRNLAAGLYPDPKASQLKAHAATCGRCGPLLQEYIEDFSDESSPEEQAFLDQLRSASPEFRQQKAREMFERKMLKKNPVIPEPVPSTDWRRFFSWKWILVPALPAVAIIAVGIWYLQRDTPEKVEKQLAQASTEQRMMEMRWPGAEWAQRLPQERGSSTKQPPVLFEAKSSILRNLKKNPKDWRWLHELGAEEVLEHHLDDAVADLTQALQIRPNSTAIMLDLATAHFQRGRATQNSSDYRQAVELLGKVLEAEPNNAVALFNRAILYQEMSPPLYDLAIQDWDHYLDLDKNGPWHNEAQNRKSQLEQIKKKVF
jgi:cytochrome c-type biogenesis protein CcmH/NrfG